MRKANRIAFGETLVELAKENPNILVVDADVAKSTGTLTFKEAHPDKFINVGIAEQNMVGVAAGLATCGKIPFAVTFGVFASMRAVEQVRNSVCYTKLNVKIVGTHGGLETGQDGGTHQAIEDIAIIRSLPNIQLFVPSTPNQTVFLTKVAASINGPVYLRFGKDPTDEFYSSKEEFPIGKSKVLDNGSDITVIACGNMVHVAVEAAELLKKDGVHARVIDMYSLKPIDEEEIIKAAKETAGIITIEDHTIIGGLGGGVCEVTATSHPAKVIRIGLQDRFGRSGDSKSLHILYGLTAENIVKAAKSIC